MTLRRKLTTMAIAVLAVAGATSANAQLPDRNYWRWFEVEVLLFKHTVEQQLNEQFPLAVDAIPIDSAEDLLTPHFNDELNSLQFALEVCEPWPALGEFGRYQLQLDCYVEDLNHWLPITNNPLAAKPAIARLTETPVVINGEGGDISRASNAFLLPDSSHVLTETRTELQRKRLAQPLLHVAWRQPVFKESQAYAMRLFAGQQFSESFNYDGYPRQPDQPQAAKTTTPSPIDNITRLLQLVESGALEFSANTDPLPPKLPTEQQRDYVWQLDGLLHIFLIGNYLHIDNEFNLREVDMINVVPPTLSQQADDALSDRPRQQPFLRAYHFDQRRRVISHETHYFDHPKVGMVIQIRRTDLSAPRY